MSILPRLIPRPQTRLTTAAFTGYDHRLKIPDGALYHTQNLSSRCFPMLATRAPRAVYRTLTVPQGLTEKDALAWVDGGTLYYNALPTPVTGLAPGEKQLISMGAYLLIFPDKVYFNTADFTDYGSMEASWSYTGTVALAPCRLDGTLLPDAAESTEEPSSPANGDTWLDSGTLRQYSAALGLWVELPTPYTRLSFSTQGQLPALFRQYDGVSLSGPAGGEKLLYAVGGGGGESDYIVVAALTPTACTLENSTVEISRKIPDMDYVCQCGNRLWGCRCGVENGKTVNELYASALGDFKNFRQYLGLSTDSWTASVGSDGVFTGAVSFMDSPVFFKENCLHRIILSANGAHRVSETVCRGVQKGSHKSLRVVGETLYYKSREGVCAWQGGLPVSVSAQLGDVRYHSACAGALGSRYYLCMSDGAGERQLFVYDTALQLWYREDSVNLVDFAFCDGELYALNGDDKTILSLTGVQGTPEAAVPWSFDTGILHYRQPEQKYLSRYALRLSLEAGHSAALYVEYDSSGCWLPSGSITAPAGGGAFSVTLPVRPRRCDHLRLRLEGTGQLRLFSISRIMEKGSDNT